MILFLILAGLIAVLAVLFAVQNTAIVTVSFIVWSFQGSLALILLLALFAGVLICLLLLMPSLIKNRWALRQQKKRIATLELGLSDNEQALANYKQRLRALEQTQATEPAPSLPIAPTPTPQS